MPSLPLDPRLSPPASIPSYALPPPSLLPPPPRLSPLPPPPASRLSPCIAQVTETQFLRVLAMFSLVPGRADERAALLAYFRGSGAKAHMTDYRAFLAEVAGEDEAAAAAGGGGH